MTHQKGTTPIGTFLYNINPANIVQGKSIGCGGQRHDKTTAMEKAAIKIQKFFTPKHKSHVKHDKPIKHEKPSIQTNPTEKPFNIEEDDKMEPIKPLDGKLPTTKSKLVIPNPETDKDELETYNNFANNHDGFAYKKNQDGEYQIDLKGKNLPEAVSKGAFDLMHNTETSVELGKKNFSKMFDDLRPSNEQSDKPLTEEEFIRFHAVYTKNAAGELGRLDKDIREKANTVDMDPIDKEHLHTLFNAMSGGEDTLTKQQYIDFNKAMFDKYASGKNGQDHKLTRAEQDKFIAEWIDKHQS